MNQNLEISYKENLIKKIIFVLVLSAILFLLISCGKSDADVASNSETIEAADDHIEINNIIDENKEPQVADDATINNANIRVVCYGDSMTEGTGGNGMTMPISLAEVSGAEVINYGGFGETTSCIAARQGGNPQYSNFDVTIPEDTEPVEVTFSGKYGYEMLLVFADAGINPCVFAGVKGNYFIDEEGNRFFKRLEKGEEVFAKEGTPLVTYAMQDKSDEDVLVLWTGNNEQPSNEDEVNMTIKQQHEIIDYSGSDKYIVISLTSYDMLPEIDLINQMFKEEYGEHYLDLRKYMLNDALSDAGIEATETDLRDIEMGNIPSSLRSDEVHGNSMFYKLAGERVYIKLKELGYLE